MQLFKGLTRLLLSFASGSPSGTKNLLLLLVISGILKDFLSRSGSEYGLTATEEQASRQCFLYFQGSLKKLGKWYDTAQCFTFVSILA